MVYIICIFIFLAYYPIVTLLPSFGVALVGALTGMLFYMIQMILPALYGAFRKKQYRDVLPIVISPIIFPLWFLVKGILGEKRADKYFPTLNVFEHGPVWV